MADTKISDLTNITNENLATDDEIPIVDTSAVETKAITIGELDNRYDQASDVTLNTTHRTSDGKDHSDVVLNNTHRTSDGKDHSDVVLNNTHRTSDGKDHSDVVLNNTHRTSDGADHTFIDQDVTIGSSPTFDAANITGIVSGSVEQVHIRVRKSTAGTIAAGTPVYFVSWNASGYAEVEAADASSALTMPAIGVTEVSTTNTVTVEAGTSGTITALDTSAFSVGDAVYVASGGGLTATKPTGNNLVQKVGIITRSNVSQGTLLVVGAGRTNDLPNLAHGSVWLGDPNGVPSALGIGTASQVLTSNGTTASWQDSSGGTEYADDVFRIQDNADNTKEIAFQASGITTGNTRILTVQDTDGTLITDNHLVNSALSAPAFHSSGTWITGGDATTTKPHHLIEPSGAASTGWSTSGTGLGINAASGFTGNLLDMQVNGTSRFNVPASGQTLFKAGGHKFESDANALTLSNNSGTRGMVIRSDFTIIPAASSYRWGNLASFSSDLVLERDAADTLALRRTTNAQAFRVYNTYTDASNYERVNIKWDTNELVIGTEKAGTGTARPMAIQTDGTDAVNIDTSQNITIAGNLLIGTIKSGATQAAAGAAANELWKTASHATLPDNVVMIGV